MNRINRYSYRSLAALAAGLLLPLAVWGQIPLNVNPSRVLGHAQLRVVTANPNLVEGRELFSPQSVAVDSVRNYVYVSDTGNNRVLGWSNASAFVNGAPANIVVGQRDLYSTFALGPGTTLSSGLNSPTGLAVDRDGNLYVADSGNNRVIRYPQPFAQPEGVRLADFVIGQTSISGSRAPNAGGLSERSLQLSGAGPFRVGIVFDAQGNLLVSDAGNHRVLRYPANALGAGAAPGPAATLVLGQPTFRSNATLDQSQQSRMNKQVLRAPSGLALDQDGRLYVTDSQSRVVVYAAPLTSSQDAARVMGIVIQVQGQTPLPGINRISLGLNTTNGLVPPEGVFAIGNKIFVCDSPASRIQRFPAFADWPPESATQFSPEAEATIGQDTSTQDQPAANRGLADPTANTLNFPTQAVWTGSEVFVADSSNHRVLALPNISTGPALTVSAPYSAKRVLGQENFEYRSPNQIDGREFYFNGPVAAAGIAIDNSSNPPRLYVSDPNNNRVLGFADARKIKPGDRADVVIGQPDFFRSLINFPSNSVSIRNNIGLFAPIGIAVDASGNLWVADTGNGRVLRFPSPFRNAQQRADLVIGQLNFTSSITDATARTMAAPYGLAFTSAGHLLVSDSNLNRVLLFTAPFSNGMAASRAFGQPDFENSAGGTANNRFNGPRHIAVDSDDRLYACDAGNGRVLIFSRAPLAGPDPQSAFRLERNLINPHGVYVNPMTGEIWVASAGGSAAVRYPNFDALTGGPGGDAANYSIPSSFPVAIAQDSLGSLYVADLLNRVAVYYPGVDVTNGANYLTRAAPGMVTTLLSRGRNYRFTEATKVFNELPNPVPLPKTLGDLEVLIDDVPAPLYFTSPDQINFLMPNGAPTSGTVDLQVAEKSTGRVVAATQLRMDVSSPAFFTVGSTGTGQIAALNQDGSINSINNRARRGEVIQMFGTGPGFIPNAPPDGSLASGLTPTQGNPRVFVQSREVTVAYSGLAPGLVGVWQVNVTIPMETAPNDAALVVLTMNDIPSNNPQNPNQIRTTISVQ